MEKIKNRPAADQCEEDQSILEEILLRGMSLQDAVVMMVDMLLAGIDTVSCSLNAVKIGFLSVKTKFMVRHPTRQVSCCTFWPRIRFNRRNYAKKFLPLWDPKAVG